MQAGYATPKTDVRAAILRDGKILLVRELDGKWALPGGWCDLGETPSEMAVRETREESGFDVKVEKVLAVYDANRLTPLEFYHAYKIVFLCAITGGAATTSYETSAVAFFAPDALPPLSESRTNPRMIAEIYAHVADPARPAAFD